MRACTRSCTTCCCAYSQIWTSCSRRTLPFCRPVPRQWRITSSWPASTCATTPCATLHGTASQVSISSFLLSAPFIACTVLHVSFGPGANTLRRGMFKSFLALVNTAKFANVLENCDACGRSVNWSETLLRYNQFSCHVMRRIDYGVYMASMQWCTGRPRRGSSRWLPKSFQWRSGTQTQMPTSVSALSCIRQDPFDCISP